MPQKKSVSGLTDLCFKMIDNNIKHLHFQDEINKLPDVLINELQERTTNGNLPSKLFISARTKNLEKSKFDLTPTMYIRIVSQVCKNLQQFAVGNRDPPWIRNRNHFLPECLKTIVLNNSRITDLDISRTYCTDSDMQVIGDRCPQLKHLNLFSCLYLTDKGMNRLCKQTTGETRNLKLITLSIEETFITPSGCLVALNNLPFLKKLETPDKDWLKICKLLANERRSDGHLPNYNIEQIIFHDSDLDDLKIGEFQSATKRLPKLNELCMLNRRAFGVRDLLRSCPNLTSLKAITIGPDDLEVINRCCALLRILVITIIFSHRNRPDEEMSANEDSFKHLRELTIYAEEHGSKLDQRHYAMLLTNCFGLEKLYIVDNYSLTDGILLDILDRNPLSNLKSVRFLKTMLTVAPLKRLLEIDNALCHVYIGDFLSVFVGIPFGDMKSIIDYIEEKNLYVRTGFVENFHT